MQYQCSVYLSDCAHDVLWLATEDGAAVDLLTHLVADLSCGRFETIQNQSGLPLDAVLEV